MERIFFVLVFYLATHFSINAQVVQKQSNKYQLKNGIKLDSKNNFKKIIINTSKYKDVNKFYKIKSKKNKEIPKKPRKILKYGLKHKE